MCNNCFIIWNRTNNCSASCRLGPDLSMVVAILTGVMATAVGPHVTRKTFLRRDLFFHVHRTTPKLANSPDRNGSLFSPGTFACLKLRRPDKIL